MKHTIKLLFGLIFIAAFSAGCSTLQSTDQSPDPIEQTAAYEAMATQIMETTIAEITQQALLNPSATMTNTEVPPPTQTSEPSATSVPPTLIATNVPPTIVLPTSTFTVPAVTATRTDFNCQVSQVSPSWNFELSPGGDFDGRWTFKNTGSEVWEKENIDFLFISGTEFHEHVSTVDLPKTVAKQETVEFIIDMLAPSSPGTYSATWGLKRDGSIICMSTIQIIVK